MMPDSGLAFTKCPNGRPDTRKILFIETFTTEKLPWATTPAVHSFKRFPAIEDYMKLVDEYRKQAMKRSE